MFMSTPFLEIFGMNANEPTICTHYLDKKRTLNLFWCNLHQFIEK